MNHSSTNHLSYNLTNHLLSNLTKFNETLMNLNFLLYNLKESFIIQFKESFIYNLKNFLKNLQLKSLLLTITTGYNHY